MPITATIPQSANYAPKSNMAEGLNPAVVFRVEDLGIVPYSESIIAKNRARRLKEGGDPNSVKTAVHKARVFFNNAKGEYISKDYNLSLHEKAALAIDLKRLGKKVEQSFDVETLLGTQAQLMVSEETSQRGNPYKVITAIAKPAPGQNVKARKNEPIDEKKGAAPQSAPLADGTFITDDDLPAGL